MAVGQTRTLADRLAPLRAWCGVLVAPLAWILCQQGAGYLVYTRCGHGGPPWGPLIGLASAVVCAGAGWISWTAPKPEDAQVQAFARKSGVGVALLFALASLVLTAATLVIPPCVR